MRVKFLNWCGGWLLLGLGLSGARGAEVEAKGPLDRLVSYFSNDLKVIDEEMTQLKAKLNARATPTHQTRHLGYSSSLPSGMGRELILDLGKVATINKIVLVPVESASTYGWSGPGYGFPVVYRVEVSPDVGFAESVQVASAGANTPNPGSNPVVIEVGEEGVGLAGRYVRIYAVKPWQRRNRDGVEMGAQVFAMGEVMVLSGNLNLAAGLPPASITTPPGDSEETRAYGKAYLVDGQSILGPPVSGDSGTKGALTEVGAKADAPAWMQIDLEQEISVEEIRLLPALNPDMPERRGYGFPTSFKVELSNDAKMAEAKVLGTYKDTASPYENPVTIRGNGATGRYVRVTADTLGALDTSNKTFAFALGEMEVYNETENFALGKKVTCSTSVEKGGWGARFLVDGTTSQGKLLPWQEWFDKLDERKDARNRLEQLRQEREVKSKGAVETVIRTAGYVLAGSTLLFVYLSFRSLLKKRKVVEELRARIARDIHDEIGSGMGTISLLSRMAQDGDWDDAKEDLREINRLSVAMAESVRDIVWFNRTDVDTVRDLLMKMRETAETMLGKHMQIDFQTLGAELVRPMDMEIRREIFLIYKEALHNIQKHAQATKVEIRAGLEGGEFVLHLRDDGKGFDLSAEKAGAGMGSMKKRAESLRGDLQVETAPGGGTSLALHAKLK